MLALTTIHSTGINWGQALATWIPIVIALVGCLGASIRGIRKWQDTRQARLEKTINGATEGFALTIAAQMQDIHRHLTQQDQRLDRIDRNTGTDST
jgi:hypothetical protein